MIALTWSADLDRLRSEDQAAASAAVEIMSSPPRRSNRSKELLGDVATVNVEDLDRMLTVA